MTSVLLIKPKFSTALSLLVDEIPIGLEYISAYVENDVEKIVIADLEHDKINLKQEITKIKPDIVGITGQMAWHNEIARLARKVRKLIPKTKIIAGGYYPSLFPQLLQLIPEIDLIVKGEGELTFKELINKGFDDLFLIKGLYFRENKHSKKIVFSGQREHIANLDAIPFPARHLRRSYYTHFQLSGRYYDVITTARGCVGKCSYCCEPFMYGKPRRRSPENVVAEIDEIVRFHKGNPMQITITDPNFVGRTTKDAERVERICELLEERDYDLSFSVLVRADMIARHPEMVQKMTKNGFNFFELGIESPNREILKNTRKGTTVRTMVKAVKNINQAGGFPLGTLMFGFEGQSEENIKLYPMYAKKIGLKEAAFAIATPLVGTAYFEEVKGKITEFDFSKYTYLHPTILYNSSINSQRSYFLLGYCYGQFYSPELMKNNEKFYDILNRGKKNSFLSYFQFAIRSLEEFSFQAKLAFFRGAITGYIAKNKMKNPTI